MLKFDLITNVLKKILIILVILILTGQFAYSQLFESIFLPEKYIVFQCPSPPIIDGVINEPVWQAAKWTESFVDIEGRSKPKPKLDTKVKMLWDDKYFYIAARIYDKQIWANVKKSEGPIFEDNDLEVYIDPDGDAHNYMELEINALGTISDMFMDKPYRDGGEANLKWNFAGLKKAVKVYGKINNMAKKDSCWTIEMAIPWKTMLEYTATNKIPIDGEQWRINFLRVQWKTFIKDNEYRKDRGPDKKTLPPMNWTWSPQNSTDMHQPETWGYIQFSTQIAGTGVAEFRENPDAGLIWSLWQVYYLYQTYPLNRAKIEEDFLILKNKKYASNQDFKMVELGAKKDKYLANAPSTLTTGFWYISKEGRIWFEKQ
jgi:hypothetical protein